MDNAFSKAGMIEKNKVEGKKDSIEKDEKIKKKILKFLEEEGVLRYENEISVVNIDTLKTAELFQKMRQQGIGRVRKKEEKLSGGAGAVYKFLQDMEVVSIEDFEESKNSGKEIKTKSLFNVPESIEDAFDPELIRNKEYYLNLWDTYENNIQWGQGVEVKNGEKLNMEELHFATTLFRDLKAKRDENGILLVYDEKQDGYIRPSFEWLKKNTSRLDKEEGRDEFLKNNCSYLLEKGLISHADFYQFSLGERLGYARPTKEISTGSPYIMLKDVQYYMGKEFFIFDGEKIPTKNMKVVLLDEETGGIISLDNGAENLKYIFSLLNEEEKNQRENENVSTYVDIGGKEVKERTKLWKVDENIPQRKDETDNDYAEKISHLKDFGYVDDITNKFADNCHVKMLKLSWREQSWVASLAYEMDLNGNGKDLIAFTRKYREEGLKCFLSQEFDQNNGQKIIDIGEKIETKEAQKVFAKIVELGDLAQKKDEELSKIIYKDNQKELPASVQTELLRKAHNIISRFSDELKDGEKPDEEKIAKILKDLEQSRIEIDLVASLLIAGKKEGEVQSLEDIKGLEISEISGKEVLENSELIGRLREMYLANNSHKSKEDLERLMNDFEKHLEHDAKFYLVYFDKDGKSGDKKLENLAGFMRSSNFDGIKKLPEGERYLGAMNIDPLLQKFYFGDNFSRETNERELVSGAKKLIAHVPEGGRTYELLMKQGFKRVAQEGEYKNDDGSVLARRLRVELTKD